MSRIVLPGDRPARRPVSVIVPHDGDRPATGFCGVCEVPWYSDRDMRAHLRSGAHADAVALSVQAEHARKERLAIFHTSSDPELESHMARVGGRMLKEGRLVVRKSERAGF